MASPTMDKDYDYGPVKRLNNDGSPAYYGSNLGVAPMEPVLEQEDGVGTPPPRPSPAAASAKGGNNNDVDEALLDLAQLEDLHNEAERMKALGNKHMAAQVGVFFLFLAHYC